MILARATRRLSIVALFAVVLLGADPAGAQTCVSLTTLGSAVAQNFDTLASSGTSSALPSGWYMSESGTNANTTYTAGTGSSNTGDTYSFGAAASVERAFGGLRSGTLIPLIGACFTNNTGATVTTLAIAYTGEEWRLGVANRTDQLDFQISTSATSLTTGSWTDVDALDFVTPATTGVGAKDGNAAANRTAISSSIAPLWLVDGATIWIRWNDLNATGADDGLSVDDFALTPTAPDLAPIVSATAPGNGATNQTPGVAVSLTFSEPVTISGTVAIACSGSPTQNVMPTGGPLTFGLPHADFPPLATCTVTVLGAQVNDQDGTPTPMAADFAWSFGVGTGCGSAATLLHDIQGSGASSPLVGVAATVEAIVVADFQGTTSIRGFFLEEPNAEHDGDPATSEGLFVFDNNFGVPVAVGDAVRVNGTVSEFQNQSQLSTITSVVVCASGVGLPPAVAVTLPFADPAAPERYEGMRVSFAQALTVTETFNLGRGGILTLSSARLQQPTNVVLPGAPANALQAANNLDKITLDDGSLTQNPDPIVYPPPGLTALNSVRGGDTVSGLAGVFTQGNPGWTTPGNIYRVHPEAMPTFTPANPRPPAPAPVGGTLRVSSFNVLNYFVTLDTGPDICGPLQNQECRGADSAIEFTRQRDKTLQALVALDAEVLGLMELENTLGVEPLQDLVNGLNALAGAGTYAFIATGTIGDDAIKVGLIYQPAVVQPVGAFAILDSSVDPNFDTSLNRPALAQTFEQISTGGRFTVVVNHLKSKGCSGAAGLDTDQGDGQSCFNHTRTLAAGALAAWAASDPTGALDLDVLLLGDFNAYALEDPVAALLGAGYTDLAVAASGPDAYSYVFDAQAGSLDHSLAGASLLPQITGVTTWHVNADEPGVLDYNVEFKSAGQIASLYNADAFRTSDHDPILIGLDLVAPQADLSITKTDSPDPVAAGALLTYTITVANSGPNEAADVTWSDELDPVTSFVSLTQPAGWTCDPPPIGASGTFSCSRATFAPGSAVFTLVVEVGAQVPAGFTLANIVAVESATGDPNATNNSHSESTSVISVADLSVVKAAMVSPATAGLDLVYDLTVGNSGPSWASNVTVTDPLPAGTTFVSISAVPGWSCATPPPGSGGVVSCTAPSFFAGPLLFTLVVHVDSAVPAGTLLVNSASIVSASGDPDPADNLSIVETPVIAPASVSATKSVAGEFAAGGTIFYTLVLANAGPADQPDAAGDELVDALPAGLQLVSATASAGTATADLGTGVVTWNGVIPAGGSVTVTIEATIPLDVEHGTIYANQGIIAFDGDGDGVNESSAVTDDPATGEEGDPTEFQVLREVQEIPALDGAGLLLLGLLLAGIAAHRLRASRRRAVR